MLWPSSRRKKLGDVVVADEQRFVLAVGQRRIGERVLDAVDLGAGLEQRLERERRLIERARGRSARARPAAGSRRSGPTGERPGPRSGFVEAGQHPEKRRLAGAVRAAETDAIAVRNGPRHVVEQDALAEATS